MTALTRGLHITRLHRLAMLLLGCIALIALPASSAPTALLLSIDGAIGPATEDYLRSILESGSDAEQDRPALYILRMDTPGGLDSAMRGIIKAIIASPVPVVTYVAPSGARAASAGTYILYASHIAAMAPGTNLGAATPVQIGGGFPGTDKTPTPKQTGEPLPADGDGVEQGTGATAIERKTINDAAAYIRGLAELRGRNGDWGERAVREAVSLQASEALALNVIDVVAADLDSLLKAIDGREVQVRGKTQVLTTGGLVVVERPPGWRARLLAVIANPNVAYILMLVGIYGLILEFYNPGAILPGTLGAICLLLALYAFQVLPVNYAGVALILLGIALMIAEMFQPSFGILGVGGLAAFVIGSVILMDRSVPEFTLYLSVVATFAVVSALFCFLIVGMALKSRHRPVVSGVEQLLHENGTITRILADGRAQVLIHGEHWSAHGAVPLQVGQRVRVVGIEGLELEIAPITEPD